MAFENYTILQFIDALYKDDRSVMSEDELNIVYDEYVDISELYDIERLQDSKYIHFLNNRINSVKMAIKLQKMFLEEFGVPYEQEFIFFRRFGYIIKWKDKESFLIQLEKIENGEKKFISQLEGKVKEFIEKEEKKLKEKEDEEKEGKVTKIKQSRGAFISMLNSLRKIGWVLDKQKDTVEDLAYAIKSQLDENKKQ